MKLLFLLVLFLSTFVGVAQNNQLSKTPVQILYKGTDQNTLKGMEWLIKAAEQGNDSAFELLADIYDEGTFGVASNAEKAKHWKEMFSKRGEI